MGQVACRAARRIGLWIGVRSKKGTFAGVNGRSCQASNEDCYTLRYSVPQGVALTTLPDEATYMRNHHLLHFIGLVPALAVLAIAHSALTAAFQDENILVPLPKGFVIATQVDRGAMTMAEYIPQGETVSNWSQMVTVQVFHNLRSVDPDSFAKGLGSRWLAACAGSEVHKAKDGQENGYNFSLWLFACPMNTQTGKPENMFNKLISGTDSLYSIQYAYRSPLTTENIPPAVQYLASIHACDTRLPDRPCPAVAP